MPKKKRSLFNRKNAKYITYVITFLIIGFALYALIRKPEYTISPAAYTKKYNAVYQYIHDGDTAVFTIEDGKEVICRFLAVDTPEIGEEGYEEAKHFTDQRLEKASRIILEIDPNSEEYDKFDRLLAWVWVDGTLLQKELIENDLAQIRYIYNEYLYLDYLNSLK